MRNSFALSLWPSVDKPAICLFRCGPLFSAMTCDRFIGLVDIVVPETLSMSTSPSTDMPLATVEVASLASHAAFFCSMRRAARFSRVDGSCPRDRMPEVRSPKVTCRFFRGMIGRFCNLFFSCDSFLISAFFLAI